MRKPQCKWDSVHSGPQNAEQRSFTERFGSKEPNGPSFGARWLLSRLSTRQLNSC